MVALKKLYAGAILLLVVFATGCIGTSTNSNQTSSPSSTTLSSTETNQQWTPSSWIAYDKDITLDGQYYIGDIEITHTSKVTMQLDIISGAESISYLAIIPASELEKWKGDSTSLTYEFISHHVKSGTYTATLSPGTYYVLVGIADPIYMTLAEGTEVIDAGKYIGIPISLSNILYAENVKATIDIREKLDINLDFMRASEFQIYQEGGTPRVVASYEKAESGTYDITNGPPSYLERLDPDIYYLVLDNEYSVFTDKTIDYKVTGDVVYPAEVHLTIKVEETG
ncbi:hypothetical protein [Thermococcus aciditolerans]|uniref:Uncharacterized protein n=1 Tax=Thermococcus aciditolerans TaxID=2598455 RepID=A0A5C0SKC2_9EURY|nr:hypothetical protein [Thermococcus aciditolerans]QEK14730.1 hypothetical protein FPV09_06075 [Thermococcus aciditolerans]